MDLSNCSIKRGEGVIYRLAQGVCEHAGSTQEQQEETAGAEDTVLPEEGVYEWCKEVWCRRVLLTRTSSLGLLLTAAQQPRRPWTTPKQQPGVG